MGGGEATDVDEETVGELHVCVSDVMVSLC